MDESHHTHSQNPCINILGMIALCVSLAEATVTVYSFLIDLCAHRVLFGWCTGYSESSCDYNLDPCIIQI